MSEETEFRIESFEGHKRRKSYMLGKSSETTSIEGSAYLSKSKT